MTSTGTKPKFGEVWDWEGSRRMVITPKDGEDEGVYVVLTLDDPGHTSPWTNYFPPQPLSEYNGNWKRLRAVDE